jgi:hypothetical protein
MTEAEHRGLGPHPDEQDPSLGHEPRRSDAVLALVTPITLSAGPYAALSVGGWVAEGLSTGDLVLPATRLACSYWARQVWRWTIWANAAAL